MKGKSQLLHRAWCLKGDIVNEFAGDACFLISEPVFDFGKPLKAK